MPLKQQIRTITERLKLLALQRYIESRGYYLGRLDAMPGFQEPLVVCERPPNGAMSMLLMALQPGAYTDHVSCVAEEPHCDTPKYLKILTTPLNMSAIDAFKAAMRAMVKLDTYKEQAKNRPAPRENRPSTN